MAEARIKITVDGDVWFEGAATGDDHDKAIASALKAARAQHSYQYELNDYYRWMLDNGRGISSGPSMDVAHGFLSEKELELFDFNNGWKLKADA